MVTAVGLYSNVQLFVVETGFYRCLIPEGTGARNGAGFMLGPIASFLNSLRSVAFSSTTFYRVRPSFVCSVQLGFIHVL